MDIKVTYNGEYPCMCMGTLTIIVDGEQVYSSKHCCYSTGCVWLDGDYNAYVSEGQLKWNEDTAILFSKEIQEAVEKELLNYHVCCGGCI